MYHGTQDLLAWFRRNGKKGWRLNRGKDIIAEYFDAEGSNESAANALETELSYLRGGTYHIDAKDSSTEARKILSTDFIIAPTATQAAAAVSGTSHHMPEGMVTIAQMQAELRKEMELYDLKRKNQELQEALEEMVNSKPEKQDMIGKLLENEQVQALAFTAIGKLLGGATQMPIQRQIGIAGRADSAQVPPAPTSETEKSETHKDELTDEQDERMINAFYETADQVGSVEDTVVLLECLPRYIAQNKMMYETIVLPEILKYK